MNSAIQQPTTEYAGPLDPAFLFADGMTLRELEQRSALQLPLGEAERRRLVEATKSPTRDFPAPAAFHQCPRPLALDAAGPVAHLEQRAEIEANFDLFRQRATDAVGTKTLIQYREWADEWRIRTQVDSTVGTPPPANVGDRYSDMLSDRGARAIADACAYMAAKRGGFKTFVTGTLNADARRRIVTREVAPVAARPGETHSHTPVAFDDGVFRPVRHGWESSLQREITRTMDALSKMYRRGWYTSTGEFVPPAGDRLAYCWVVEVPKNEQGEDNPHVHMLLDWQVEFRHFREWSARIEAIWGNGYFHLEKINDPLCAGAYMAKAAGYLTKAQGQDGQGRVRGNRYAISADARAPSWYTVGTYELGVMGHLIREVYDAITARHAAVFAERKRLAAEREDVRQRAREAQQAHPEKRYPIAAKNRLERIGAKLAAVRSKIAAIPVRASKYQLVLKGSRTVNRFLGWAQASGWRGNSRPDSHWYSEFKRRLYDRKRLRDAWGLEQLAAWTAQKIEEVEAALAGWAEYAMVEGW